ncbi:DnaJ-domain-containing protein [Meredithblackwellia eburnea MCA 4105]
MDGFVGEEGEEDPLFRSGNGLYDDEQLEEAIDNSERDSLYSILNLDKQATEDDIHKAYKRLAALLHPDRHLDPANKQAADSSFQRLQHAYEVLSDPQKRIIYDSLGEEGLKTKWEVGPKGKSSAEMRLEFEKLQRKDLEKHVNQLVRAQGELTCTTDARVLLLSTEERIRLGGPRHMTLKQRVDSVNVRQMFLKHSFTTPINPNTSVILTSQLLSRNSVGAGNVLIKLQHRPSSKLQLELGTTALRPRAFSVKATYTPDSDSFVNFETAAKTLASPPRFTVTVGRRVSDRNTASFTLRSGAYALGPWGLSSLEPYSSSTFSLGLVNTSGYSLDLTSGLFGTSLSGDYARTVLAGVRVRVGASFSTQGGLASYVKGTRRVTENTRAELGVELAMNGTMTVKLSVMRLGQKLILPVIVSSSFNPTLALTFTVIPALSVVVANHYIVAPRKRRKITNKIAELRKENSEYILEKRKEAAAASKLLEEHVARKVEEERRKDGLVILEAVYGILEAKDTPGPASEEELTGARWLDITVPLSALISSSQLIVPGGRSKSHILGVYDCAMGENKRLRVRYLFKGREHEVIVADTEALSAPLRAHVVG